MAESIDYPMEIAHVEEIGGEMEEVQEEEEIIISPEEPEEIEPAQQYVLVKSTGGVTRTIRVHPGSSSQQTSPVLNSGGVQYVQTESGGLIQIRNTSRAEVAGQLVQRVVNTPKQIVIKGSDGQQYVVNQPYGTQPKVVSPTVQIVQQQSNNKKTITLAQAQQMGLLKGATSSSGKVVTLNPTIRNEQPKASPSPRVIKVTAQTPNQSAVKLKPVTGDSPRVIHVSTSGGPKATAAPLSRPRATEPNVQYIEVASANKAVRMVKAGESSQASTPNFAYKHKYYNTALGQRTVMIQQKSALKQMIQEEPEDAESKWKVSRSTADALVKMEGSVVIPGVGTSKIVVLPSDYLDKLDSKDTKESVVQDSAAEHANYSVIVDESEIVYREASPMNEPIKKRPCNCTKSQCLKLYCECFANGEFCSNCNCKECFNTMEYEEERQAAIYNCLERNPNAFRPKIGQVGNEADAVRHHKGCNCKRSGCLKNYCECFEAKVACSSNCKCVDCKNSEDHPDHPPLAPTKTSMGSSKRAAASSLDPLNSMKVEDEEPPPKQPYNFMTADVVDATVQCMMAQADECQQKGLNHQMTEMLILEEFGRCLLEIIDFSSKNATE